MDIKKVIVVLLLMSIVPLCAMEKKKVDKLILTELQKKRAAEGKRLKKNARAREWLDYPEGVDVISDEKLVELNKDMKLGKGPVDFTIYKISNNSFLVPQGMDATLINATLVPERISDQSYDGDMI